MTGTDDKPDEVGMKLFLATVREALSQEAPIQEWTEFEKILYSPTVWRSKGESMSAYIVRRNQEFSRAENQITNFKIPEKMKASLLLKFSGLGGDSRSLENRTQHCSDSTTANFGPLGLKSRTT